MVIISDAVPAYDTVWFLGDEFAISFFEQYFKEKTLKGYNAGYIRNNYDVMAKLSSQYMSQTKNFLSRFRNLLVSAITDQPRLPKIIVNILDTDLMKNIDESIWDDTKALNRVIGSMMSDQSKLILTQKSYLQQKAKRTNYPHIVWIEAPIHNNFPDNYRRERFNYSLNHMVQFQEDTTVLKFKKIWDSSNSRLYIRENERFTCEGLSAYWAAVDCTLRYLDTILLKKFENKGAKKPKKSSRSVKWTTEQKETYSKSNESKVNKTFENERIQYPEKSDYWEE